MFLLPSVCLQFWVFSSCQCQKQTSVKQSTYCSFIEFEEDLLSGFSFGYFYTTTKAARVPARSANQPAGQRIQSTW